MVKRVLTSIITLAVLMGVLVACSGSDSEVAELRAELEELKEEKNQETANAPQATSIPNSTPSTPDFEENKWTNDDSTTFREECEEVASIGMENTKGVASYCIDMKNYAEQMTNNNAEKYCAREQIISYIDGVPHLLGDPFFEGTNYPTIQSNCQMTFCSTYNDWMKDVDGGFNPKPPNVNPAYTTGNPEPLYPDLWVMCFGWKKK